MLYALPEFQALLAQHSDLTPEAMNQALGLTAEQVLEIQETCANARPVDVDTNEPIPEGNPKYDGMVHKMLPARVAQDHVGPSQEPPPHP